MSEREEKDKKVGMAVSVGIHALVLLAFFFILAWRAPDPPRPDYGIELNFGLDAAGSGNKQPVTPANQSKEDNMESQQQEVKPEPVQPVTPPAAEPEPAAPVAENNTPEEVVSQPEPSPVTREEVKKAEPKPKPEPKKEEPKPVAKAEPVKEPKKEEPKKETVKSATFPSDIKGAEAGNANQGDKDNAVGDQGSKEGSLDSRAMYGEQGGGKGGPTLNISGWRWDEAPNKHDQSTESGRIVFRFKIDDQGYVVEAQTVETTVSPKVTQFYKEQLLRTTFSPTSNNAIPAPFTTGTVTFDIKAR